MAVGDPITSDTGYGTAQNYIYAQEQGADVILRITPKNFCLYHAKGKIFPDCPSERSGRKAYGLA